MVVPYAQWQALQARASVGLKAVLLDPQAPRFELVIPARGAMNSRGLGADVFA